jgi:Holliday junction resolvase RusA-like endonuclease
MKTTIELPIPPSTNNLFATYRGRRIKSREYLAWIKEADLMLLMQRVKPVPSPVSITIRITGGEGWTKGRDISNSIKAVEDLLKMAHVIENDNCNHVLSVKAEYHEPNGGKAACAVEVEHLEDRP